MYTCFIVISSGQQRLVLSTMSGDVNEAAFVGLKDLRGTGLHADPIRVAVTRRRYGLVRRLDGASSLYIQAEIKDASDETETMRCMYFDPGENIARFNRGSVVVIKNFQVKPNYYRSGQKEIHLLQESEITEIRSLPVYTVSKLSWLPLDPMDARYHIKSDCIITCAGRWNQVYYECPHCEFSLGRNHKCLIHKCAKTIPHFCVRIDLCDHGFGRADREMLTVPAFDEHMQILLPKLNVNKYACATEEDQEKMLEGLEGIVIRGVKLDINDRGDGYKLLEPTFQVIKAI